jgi:hypothetical protein
VHPGEHIPGEAPEREREPVRDAPGAALGEAGAAQHETCPNCTFGYPLPIGGDENGTTYKCFACGYGYSVAADAESFAAELATVSIEISRSKLHALARKHGIDPDDYGSTAELHTAMVNAGGKAAGK